jgi:prolyl-tRNA editing enzyme YbaK/EbsC (Cys-tRNA(Pro) deacylase)
VGAIPPFGNLWRIPTFIDKSLLNQPKIIINGGDYKWSIKINPAVFRKLISDLIVGNFNKAKK